MANAILIPQFEPDLSGFALKEHTHDQYLTAHQSLTNYATKTYVTNQIAAIDFPDAGVLTFNGRSGAVVPKDGDYTASMVGAAPTSHSHSQYLTAHQSLTDYAKKDHTHDAYITPDQCIELISASGGLSVTGTTECMLYIPNYGSNGNGDVKVKYTTPAIQSKKAIHIVTFIAPPTSTYDGGGHRTTTFLLPGKSISITIGFVYNSGMGTAGNIFTKWGVGTLGLSSDGILKWSVSTVGISNVGSFYGGPEGGLGVTVEYAA